MNAGWAPRIKGVSVTASRAEPSGTEKPEDGRARHKSPELSSDAPGIQHQLPASFHWGATNATRSLSLDAVAQLQRAVGNRAVGRLLARTALAHTMHPFPKVPPGGGDFAQVAQRTFEYKGRKKKAEEYGPESGTLPKIHGVSATDLKALADDDHAYGAIESKQQFEQAWEVYQQRHEKQADVLPLDQVQEGNVTVLDVDDVEQNLFAGTVKMTLQLDWLQGKHDTPFMKVNSSIAPRKMQDTQIRLSFGQYEGLASDVPLGLAKERLASIFGKSERVPFDFSVMGTKQSDGLYYEISAMWATTSPQERHVLVYYHCFPEKQDQKKFGFG